MSSQKELAVPVVVILGGLVLLGGFVLKAEEVLIVLSVGTLPMVVPSPVAQILKPA